MINMDLTWRPNETQVFQFHLTLYILFSAFFPCIFIFSFCYTTKAGFSNFLILVWRKTGRIKCKAKLSTLYFITLPWMNFLNKSYTGEPGWMLMAPIWGASSETHTLYFMPQLVSVLHSDHSRYAHNKIKPPFLLIMVICRPQKSVTLTLVSLALYAVWAHSDFKLWAAC